ncbi:hypothetical protein M911_00825 [Ectothiorhodospira haloalkaliphila]|uniref:Uncharacterized protein n=1 Tax=Ectothiorhodospira haloalkaliphila TaxID=421628 RepID=W8KDY2_9GAMM|nr:hypothetical protein M911_00825 [Ectothiorhodospira haloalkaliphila]
MPLRAIPAGDPCPPRPLARIAAVAGKATAPGRMQRTTRQACFQPALLGNVLFAGQRRSQPQ